MNTTFVKITSLSFISCALVLGGCTSGDDSSPPAPNVPSNAVTITSSNAKSTVSLAITTSDTLLSAVGAEAAQAPTAMDIVNLVKDIAKNSQTSTTLNTPTGITESDFCPGGGTFTDTYTFTDTSESGTVSFTDCDLFGIILDGSVSYSSTWTLPSGPYTDNISSSLISANVSGFVATFTGMQINESGNDSTGDYSLNPFSYTLDFTGGGGFSVSLLAAITGNDFDDPICPMTGSILVTGASSTRAKATMDYPFVDIEHDDGSGTFVLVETAFCDDVFQ